MVTRRPVHQRNTLKTSVAVVNLQNATSTPGVSARFTSVELNEKPTTTPATASAPRVRAPKVRLLTRAVSVVIATAGHGLHITPPIPAQCGRTRTLFERRHRVHNPDATLDAGDVQGEESVVTEVSFDPYDPSLVADPYPV